MLRHQHRPRVCTRVYGASPLRPPPQEAARPGVLLRPLSAGRRLRRLDTLPLPAPPRPSVASSGLAARPHPARAHRELPGGPDVEGGGGLAVRRCVD